MKEIHEIRGKMRQDDKGLTLSERIKKTNDAGLKVLKEIGLKANLRERISA